MGLKTVAFLGKDTDSCPTVAHICRNDVCVEENVEDKARNIGGSLISHLLVLGRVLHPPPLFFHYVGQIY